MVFSSTVFLFLFLPIVLFLNFSLAARYRNFFLFIVSLLFYSWGEGALVFIMIMSTCVNYLAGLGIGALSSRQRFAKLVMGFAIAVNLLFLCYYKYLDFLIDMIPAFGFMKPGISPIILPIGISFYTFHGISYLVDIYRKGLPGLKNPIDLGLYISFFPQLVAGPIVRYSDISEQLRMRTVSLSDFYYGCIRFIRGLAKKIVFANSLGIIADRAFDTDPHDLPTIVSWIGITCYTLQIYFDFSGYSDMAIGLARMFGFHFKENFNHPYISTSIQDFWRRWHISLSSWFRDYVYISLGGNRNGVSRTYVNLLIVFFLTGLWHGASWSFVLWGLFHGMFMVFERLGLLKTERWPAILQHIYVLLVVMIGWVFFRSHNIKHGFAYLKSMVGVYNGEDYVSLISVNPYTVVVFLAALILITPVRARIYEMISPLIPNAGFKTTVASILYLGLFLYLISELAQTSYNPFIYFRF